MDHENNFKKIEQGTIRIRRHVGCPQGIKPVLRIEGDVGVIDMEITDATISLGELEAKAKTIYQLWKDEITSAIETFTPKDAICKFVEFPTNQLREMLGVEDFLLET